MAPLHVHLSFIVLAMSVNPGVSAGFITFVAFLIKYVMRKFNCNSDDGFKVAFFIWISAFWLTMPILTIVFWVTTTSQGTWAPGCIHFAQLCNATLWATLRIKHSKDHTLMVNRYGQPQTTNCGPNDVIWDAFFGLGFPGSAPLLEVGLAFISLIVYGGYFVYSLYEK
jgi:hypothetical protein